ncbi:GGDEF domain-containing protein [Capilliphycus salinus ALCB114379]|uniref:sensor domain-containing diguanylate cyclase n=1 Tax=Capilliphycus salinus TaxID=2768948 RepID=UPI0039A77F66
MFLNYLKQKLTNLNINIRLRTLLTVLFVVQVTGVVSLVSYLYYRSQRQTIEQTAHQLTEEVATQVSTHLNHYLTLPHQVLALNKAAIETGEVDPANHTQLERQFWQQLQIFTLSPSAISFSSPEGEFIDIVQDKNGIMISKGQYFLGELKGTAPGNRNYYLLDESGNRTTLIKYFPNWDVRKRPWYQEAVKLNKQTWATIYPIAGLPLASLAAVTPVYSQGEFQGVLCSEMLLSDISLFLAELDFSANGQAFIIDRLGNIVATSTQEQPFVENIDGEVLIRLEATQSKDWLTRTVAQKLEQKWNNLSSIQEQKFIAFQTRQNYHKINHLPRSKTPPKIQEIKLNKSSLFSIRPRLFSPKYFVRVVPYQDEYGLDWLIAVVIPETDYMGEINAIIYRTIAGAGLALICSIFICIFVTKLMTNPILNLRDAMDKFSRSLQLDINIPLTPVLEVKQLKTSFLEMANQLNLSFDEAQELNKQLAESERNTADFLNAVPVGVGIHNSVGKLIYLNQEAKRLLGDDIVPHTTEAELIPAYQIYIADTDKPYPSEELPVLYALRGEPAIRDNIMLKRNGVNIYLEVRSTPIFNSEQEITHALVVFQDITLRREAEKVLINYNQELEDEIEKRTQKLQQEIEERHKIEADLRANQERFNSLCDAIPGVIFSCVLKKEGGLNFEFVSREIEKIYEVKVADFLENSDDYLWAYISPEDAIGYEQALMKSAETLEKFSYEWRMTTPSGQQKWLQVNSQPQRRENGEICWSGIILDISDRKRIEIALRQREIELRQVNQQLKQLSRTDPLTQIANRGYFETYLQQEWQRSIREKYPLSVILLDVDYFKRYNDTYGHPAGDYCLKQIAQSLKKSVQRPADLVARYGGEEFVIILVNTDEKGAVHLAEKIRREIQNLNIPHQASEVSDRVTVSIGISTTIPTSETQPDRLIKQADEALYSAKQQGRDRYILAEFV